MKMTTADDKETIVGRSTYRRNQYYLQPICAAPVGVLYYYNFMQHYKNFIACIERYLPGLLNNSAATLNRKSENHAVTPAEPHRVNF
jgi:hypothetical protein